MKRLDREAIARRRVNETALAVLELLATASEPRSPTQLSDSNGHGRR